MGVIRAKRMGIKEMMPLSEKQLQNARQNDREAEEGTIILKSMPKRIVCEMTSACNIHCKMCGRNATEFNPTVFRPEWLSRFESVSDRVAEITLLGWGEPTLHPRFSDFLRWAYEHGMQKFFCTNGTKLHLLKEAIFDFHTELLTVSLDGANAETNNRIRCGADFDRITDNIRELVAEKKRRGVDYPYLSIVMTMMESNFRQLPDFVRLAAQLGIQEAKGVYLTVFENRMLDERMDDKSEELRQTFFEAEKAAEQCGIQLKLPHLQGEDIAGDKAHKDCFVGWRDFFLGSDGYVRSCMSTSKKLFHIDKYHTFDEMWNSFEYQELRRKVNSSEMDTPCKNCYQASFANWNRKSSFVQIGNEFAPEWVG